MGPHKPKIVDEFKAFAVKGNVVDLAVAVVIGGAFGKIVTALVSDIIMPVVGKLLPNQEWRSWSYSGLKVGDFLGAVVDFFIIAAVLFVVVVKFMGALNKKPVEAPSTKDCPDCLEKIPLAARKCRACGSAQPS